MTGLLIGTALLAVFMLIGMPVAFALAASGGAGLLYLIGLSGTLGFFEFVPYSTTASFLLTTVPMFLLMASFMDQSGLAARLFDAARVMFGSYRSGLPAATVVASAGFSAVTGASIAASATLARIAIPQMRAHGYAESLALGVVASAGTLAIMIPPSLALIIYGLLAEQSVGRLLIAGIVPGLLTAVAYVIIVWVWGWWRPDHMPMSGNAFDPSARLKAVLSTWPVLVVFIVVIGGIYSGIVTVVEAGALGAVLGLLMAMIFGKVELRAALKATTSVTSMVFTLLIGSMLFGYLLSMSRVSHELLEVVKTLDLDPYAVIAIIALFLLVLGTAIEGVAIQFLTVPTLVPIVMGVGFDPIWFGIIVVKLIEIALISPPVGMNAFVTAAAANSSAHKVFAGVTPFIIADILVLILLITVPSIVTFLPNYVMGG